jgi:hypothetical protein
MPELWVPGATGPSVEDFVARLHRSIEEFLEARGLSSATVEVLLHDGTTWPVHAIYARPGYGFLTICPYSEEGEQSASGGPQTPEELIVPIGSIVRITLGPPEEKRGRFGFTLPEA